jgi:hypothetical protein
MKKAKLLAVLLGVLPLLYGCGASMDISTPALIIEVRDARTGAPALFDAILTVRDGAFEQVVRGNSGAPPEVRDKADGPPWIGAANDRAGTYEVTITHPNYRTWHRAGIQVRWSNQWNPFYNSPVPETVRILAQLQPLEGS